MSQLLKGTPLNYCNPKQIVWVRTAAGDFPCTAETEINASQVTVVVQDNGTAHAFCASSPKETYRRILRNERGYPILVEGTVLSVGPLWGVDVYGYIIWPDYLVALRELGKKIVIEPRGDSAYLPVIDVDEKGVPHAFIPVGWANDSARSAVVLHGATVLDIEFPNDILPSWYVSMCRLCNGHFWSLPVFDGTRSELGLPPIAPERGYMFNVKDVHGPDDVDFFDIAFGGTGSAGTVLGIRQGSLTMTGAMPMYPGGPTYPFSYDYVGTADSSKAVDYTTLPPVVDEPPRSPPVSGDDYADYPIKSMTFVRIGGIVTPRFIIINGIEMFINPDGIITEVSWLSQVIWDTSLDTIKVELRGILAEDFTLNSATLIGSTGHVNKAEGTCVASYTLPMLSDLDKGLLILEQFNGTVYSHHGNANVENTTEATANEAYTTEAGVHRTFLLGPDGEKPVDPSWQHSFYIPLTAIDVNQDVVVGQTVNMQFASLSAMNDAYLNYNHPNTYQGIEGMLLGVPGHAYGKKHWKSGITFDWGSHRARVTRNSPRADHAAALEAKLSPGAKVYGIVYSNGKTKEHNGGQRALATVFKGVVTASDYRLVPTGSPSVPQYYPNSGDFHRMTSGAQYHVGSLAFEVTEIVSDQIVSGGWPFFGDYWWGKVPFRQYDGIYIGRPWTGNLFLDGSLRNIYPTEAYSASWVAQAGEVVPRYVFGEGLFDDTLVSTRLIWDDPYIWRQRRYTDGSGHWEGYVDGQKSHPAEVPRWKLDYSGPEVKCWFDGIELLELKAPIKGGSAYGYEFQDLSFDRKMVRKLGKLNP